jgi:glutaredoxin
MNEQTESSKKDNTEATHKRQKRKGVGMGMGLFIIMFIFFVLIVYSQHEVVNTIDCTPQIIASKPDVIMLGAWWCSYCYRAKKYFQQKNIHYCEYDMENTDIGKQLYQKHGAGGVPILLIGEYQLNGFSEQQVETALTLLKENSNIPN